MNQDRQSKSPTSDQLPKSVKVRSTCNACQQAKIRCSHEKPSCRRCQKHNIDCIYSISRRLGRPAKKDSQYGDHPVDKEQMEDHHHQRDKKTKFTKKKKMKEEKTQGKTDDEDFLQGRGEKEGFDNITINDTLIDDISVDDTSLETPKLTDGDRSAHFLAPDTIDLSSDSWLQDFLSSPVTDLEQEHDLLDSLGLDSSKSDDAFAAVSAGLRDLTNPSRSFPVSSPETRDQPPAASYYSPVDISPTHNGIAIGCAQGIVDAQSSYPDYPRRNLLAWPQQSSMADNFQIRLPTTMESPNLLAYTKGPKRGCEFSLSSDDFSVNPNSLTTSASRQCQSQCHEQTIRELIQVNIWASRTSTSANIDSILSCQRVVQQVAETILQCTVCSKTRVNLLIVVVVSIDNLITTLEAVTSVESGIMEGILPEHYNPLFLHHEYNEDISISGSSRMYKGGKFHFRAQVETCPLLVGGFCVPSEDKFSFVKQVFHSRLAGLLAVIRRIRICTEQMMAISPSHGRLIMMMETDRKLQLIMMKMKMLTR